MVLTYMFGQHFFFFAMSFNVFVGQTLSKVDVKTREKDTTFGQGGSLFAILAVSPFLMINVGNIIWDIEG